MTVQHFDKIFFFNFVIHHMHLNLNFTLVTLNLGVIKNTMQYFQNNNIL